MAKNPTDGAVIAPVTAYVAPKQMIERQGQSAEAYSQRKPQIRGGICEYCGVLDKNVPSEHQYKLCGHFRDLGTVRCSYCDETKNPDDIIGHSVINVAQHPDNPNKWIAWCDSYNCSKAHLARFKKNQN